MKQIKNFKIDEIPIWKIALVATSDPDYEMDRIMLVENHPNYDGYTVIHGGHCSCYEFDDTDWSAFCYSRSQVIKLAQGWLKSGWGSEKIIAPLILDYLA